MIILGNFDACIAQSLLILLGCMCCYLYKPVHLIANELGKFNLYEVTAISFDYGAIGILI